MTVIARPLARASERAATFNSCRKLIVTSKRSELIIEFMPEFHAEPYIYLPAVTHKSALIAWGAFYFRVTSRDRFKLVDDSDLKYVHPPRKDSIGACSAPYGPARVEVYDRQGRLVSSAQTVASNHCWVTGLAPDTEYVYKVFVKAAEWA